MVGSDLEDGIGKGPGGGLNGTKDFKELIQGYESLTDDHPVEVLVAFGGADKDGWRGMKFADMYQIIADGQDGAFGNETGRDAYLYQDDTANMDDEESLTLFLKYLRDGYPNPETRFLTFWDHGNTYKGFGGDSNFPDDKLYMDEITRAFERSQSDDFDLIGFDACLMASVEVAKVIEPFADYMIASEELEPGHGWLWNEVIQIYAERDNIVDAGKLMVDNFVQDVHGSGYKLDGRTLSLLNLSRYEALVTALNPVVSALDGYALGGGYSDNLVSGITKAGQFGKSDRSGEPPASIDLKHLVQGLSKEFADSQIAPDLDALIAEIDSFVIHSNQDGSRPYANGVSIAAPEDTKQEYSAYKLNDAWLDFQTAYAALRAGDTAAPTIGEQTSDDAGITATFSDDYLTEVSTLYGYLESFESDDGSIDEYFMVVAELEAQPTGTEGEYFTPTWDQRWFTVQYDPNKITAWIPAAFSGRGEDEEGPYSIYTAEIDFYIGDSENANLAALTMYVDEDMEVFDHSIQTYQYIYSGPDDEDGTLRFDKATYRIESGDAVQFYNYGFNLNALDDDDWFPTSEFAEFVQAPVFQLEYLEFADESGQPAQYYYTIWAEDVGGNDVYTELAAVE